VESFFKSRNIDLQKLIAENLNCRFALIGLIALIGTYTTIDQILPGIT